MATFKKKHPLVKTEKESKEKAKKVSDKNNKLAAKENGRSLAAWGVQPALISLVIITALAVALELLFVSALENKHQGDLNNAMAEVLKRDIDFYASERLAALQSIAASEGVLASLSEDKFDTLGLLKSTFPDLNAVYVVPSEKLNLVRVLYPKLGFASVML